MNKENYERLNELAVAQLSQRFNAYGVKLNTYRDRKEAMAELWISASVLLSDEDAARMISALTERIASDAIYFIKRQKEQEDAAV